MGRLKRNKESTHTETLAALSADFVVARQRVLEAGDSSVVQPVTEAAAGMLKALGLLDFLPQQAIADLHRPSSTRKTGAWHAFESQFFLDAALVGRKVSFSDAAKEYRAMKAAGGATWEHFVKLGESTDRRKCADASKHMEAEHQRLFESVSRAFSVHSSQPVPHSSHALPQASWRTEVCKAIDIAVAAYTAKSHASREQLHEARIAIQKWQQGDGSTVAHEVTSCFPASTTLVPSGHDRIVTAEFVAPAIAFSEKVLERCPRSLMPLLRGPWIAMHTMQKHADCHPVPSKVKYTRLTKCQEAGQCICRGGGVLLEHFVRRVSTLFTSGFATARGSP